MLMRIGDCTLHHHLIIINGNALPISFNFPVKCNVSNFDSYYLIGFCTASQLPTHAFLPRNYAYPPSPNYPFSATKLILAKGKKMNNAATRRRRVNYTDATTYVYIEPGKPQEFVSEEQLMANLKGWLENWPNDELPPDLAKFQTLDDAVDYLIKFVCELEIDGDVGSLQWYQVRLN